MNLEQIATGVIPTCRLTYHSAFVQFVESGVPVRLQNAFESGEMSLRMDAPAIRGVGKPNGSGLRRAGTSIITYLDP